MVDVDAGDVGDHRLGGEQRRFQTFGDIQPGDGFRKHLAKRRRRRDCTGTGGDRAGILREYLELHRRAAALLAAAVVDAAAGLELS